MLQRDHRFFCEVSKTLERIKEKRTQVNTETSRQVHKGNRDSRVYVYTCLPVYVSTPPTMTLPSLLFALLIATLFGSLYHLIRGGGFWRFMLYLGLSVLGFVAGHLVGLWQGWTLLPLGSLNLGMSSLGSLIVLVIGDWLSRIEPKEESTV